MDFQHDLKTFLPSVNADGSVHVSYTGSMVLVPKADFNSLIALKSSLEKENKSMMEANKLIRQQRATINGFRKALETAKEDVKEDYLSAHRGGWNKSGCGERADAEILAAAVHGASISELQKRRFTYDSFGHKKVYGRSKIFSALSVKKPEDYERIMGLYSAFPAVFNCSAEDVVQWYSKKRSKGGNLA